MSATIVLAALVATTTTGSFSYLQPVQAAGSAPLQANGYAIRSAAISAFVQHYGGIRAFGAPISNEFLLLGNRVQLFERQVIEVRPDGSVGSIDLVNGGFLPIAATAGSTGVADPALLAQLPSPGSQEYARRVAQYLAETAPDWWKGSPVNFGATYRASLDCQDLVVAHGCDQTALLTLAAELWGLPTSRPGPDPHNPDIIYLWFQHAGMVHVRSTAQTQWLRLGQLFKQVLLGAELPPDLLLQISRSPASARFYAQYDVLVANKLARPGELPETSLTGAFAEGPESQTISTAAVPPSPLPPTSPSPANAAPLAGAGAKAPGQAPLDPRFGVAEGFRNPTVMADLRAGWERIVLMWSDIQPSSAGDFTRLDAAFPPQQLQAELRRGVRVAAVLQATPPWAQLHPPQGIRSVPVNLDLPFDDPRNFWGRFVYETVRHYAGQIDEWILWNEPDFRPGDPGVGDALTWAGTEQEFARLLEVGYLAAKRANPNAVVSFPATAYWSDVVTHPQRRLFYERILDILATNPRAASNGFYHDAVSLNLYQTPDDIYRVSTLFKEIQYRHALDKPIWLTEINVIPVDDPVLACVTPPTAPPAQSLNQQAAYVVQAAALAAAAGYQRIEFFQMQDGGDACQGQSWGLTRRDRSPRPVVNALKLVIDTFASFTSARFIPLAHTQARWAAWPNDPASLVTNWQIYQVALDKPGGQRVSVLWNGDGVPRQVRVRKNGTSARLVDSLGGDQRIQDDAGWWEFTLPPALPEGQGGAAPVDPASYHAIGGDPLLLIEEGVRTGAPAVPPAAIE